MVSGRIFVSTELDDDRLIMLSLWRNHPETVDYIVKSFDEAIAVGLKLWKDGEVEKIWILGGKQIFQVKSY